MTSSQSSNTTNGLNRRTLALELADGGTQTYRDISGLTASATITR